MCNGGNPERRFGVLGAEIASWIKHTEPLRVCNQFGKRSHAIIHDEAHKAGSVPHRKRSERVLLHFCPPMYCSTIESSTMVE